MSSIKAILSTEALVSLALGGIPIAAAYGAGNETQMLIRLATLKPSDEIFLCFIGFLLLHLLVALINKWWLKPSERAADIVNYFHSITEQIGFGIQGIYRAITGAIPLAVVILAWRHGFSGSAQAIALSTILVLGSLFVCCFFSWLNARTKRRASFL